MWLKTKCPRHTACILLQRTVLIYVGVSVTEVNVRPWQVLPWLWNKPWLQSLRLTSCRFLLTAKLCPVPSWTSATRSSLVGVARYDFTATPTTVADLMWCQSDVCLCCFLCRRFWQPFNPAGPSQQRNGRRTSWEGLGGLRRRLQQEHLSRSAQFKLVE